jgi:tRNA modification GTPase
VEIIERSQVKKFIPVINKADLPHVLDERALSLLARDVKPAVWISAKYGDGIPALRDAIYALVLNGSEDCCSPQIITNVRHKTAIEKTADLLSMARESIINGLSPEFSALDVREALECLGEIAGKTVTEEVLDKIFSTFCIGK